MIDVIKTLANESRELVERYCSQNAKAVSIGKQRVLARVLGRYMMYLDMRDVSVAPHLAMDGYWETWITQAIARELQGRVKRVIDVGANVGYYTMLLADIVGEEGEVHAVEPNPSLTDCILDSVRVNGFRKRVKIHLCAAGAEDSVSTLNVIEGGDWGSAQVGTQDKAHSSIQIDVSPIDEFVQPPVDFVKIDAEGMEQSVWSGMSHLVENSPDLQVLLEYTPRLYVSRKEWLEELGSAWRTYAVLTSGEIAERTPDALHEEAIKAGFAMIWLRRR